jgi:hypothetical protein
MQSVVAKSSDKYQIALTGAQSVKAKSRWRKAEKVELSRNRPAGKPPNAQLL